MAFAKSPIPKPPPPPQTAWIDLRTGRLTKEAQDFMLLEYEWRKALVANLDALVPGLAAQADTSSGATLATLIADHNALLAKLRTSGLMAP
jgi:hypothetical protein